MADDDELEVTLLGYILAAYLPAEEPVMRWLDDPDMTSPKIRAGDHALLVGACEYHVDQDTGWVGVRDYTDPRLMRSQVYQPDRPGQPYLAPSVEER